MSDAFTRARRFGTTPGEGRILAWLLSILSAALLLGLLLTFGIFVDLLARGGDSPPPAAVGISAAGGRWLQQLLGATTHQTLLLVLCLGGLALAWLLIAVRHAVSLSASSSAARTAARLRLAVRRQVVKVEAAELLCGRETAAAELLQHKIETLRGALAAHAAVLPHEGACLVALALLAMALQPWAGTAAVLLGCLGWMGLAWWEEAAAARRAVAADRGALAMAALGDQLRRASLAAEALPEESSLLAFDRLSEQCRRAAAEQHAAAAWMTPRIRAFAAVGVAVLAWLAGVNVLRQPPGCSLADAMALAAAAACALAPTRSLRWLPRHVARGQAAADAVFAYLDRTPAVANAAQATEIPPLAESLDLRNVTLLDSAGRKLLDDVSLHAPAGTRVAVVASDDETPPALACLLSRVLDPQQGGVFIDGQDLRHCTLESLRAGVGLLLRQGLLFEGSVLENIRCGDSRCTTPQVYEAAQAAGAGEFIDRLPQGYETIIGDHASQLSPGEVFRIGLARLMLRQPKAVILEEPADDGHAEIIQAAMQKLLAGRTAVILPARLETLRTADHILVFHKGRLHAQGTHALLLERDDLYRHLLYVRFNEFAQPLAPIRLAPRPASPPAGQDAVSTAALL